MKISLQKLIILFSLLLSSNLYSQCDLPQPWVGNTGSNMTVFFTYDVVSSLPISSDSPYLVALSPEGLVVGSASLAQEVLDMWNGQQSMAVWGDDTQTPEVDGLSSGQEIIFQLVDGQSLYDVSATTFDGDTTITYLTNSTIPVFSTSLSLLCPNSDLESNSQCVLPPEWEGNTGSNMTVMLLPPFVSSLGDLSEGAYVVAHSASGLLVGSASLAPGSLVNGMQALTIWGDDTATPEVEGALNGEALSLQLVNGNSLYDINGIVPLTYAYIGIEAQPNAVTLNLVCSQDVLDNIYGCTDPIAFNYNADANSDDGTCMPVILGCTLDWADNYNVDANTDDGSCFREGCTYDWADNFDEYATIDDGSCYRDGCTLGWADNFDEYATIDDGSCYRDGCTLGWADNYDSLATISDSSCFIQLNEEEYESLSESSQGSSDCDEIVIDIQEGWNIFGYTSSQVIEIGEVMAPYDDKIYIIKDNNGSQYWPANNYNGIGDFIPGGGYQIKAYESFSISF